MLCLFLDDDEGRHNNLKEDPHDVYHVRTANEAIVQLGRHKFEFVSLDHDLGGKTFVDSKEEETGHTVAKYIATMKEPPKIIRIHSYNPSGAGNMVAALAEAALEKNLTVYYKPFNGRLF
jgi:hypothetical protein